MAKDIGAWGRSILRLRPDPHIDGTALIVRQRTGSVELRAEEIKAICAFAQAVGLVPNPETVETIKDRLSRE